MKVLFFDLGMGAAGDMLAGALYELIDDKEEFIKEINAAAVPGVRVAAEPSVKCGIRGTHMRVTVNGTEEKSVDSGHAGYAHADGDSHEKGHEVTDNSFTGRQPEAGHFHGGGAHTRRRPADIEAVIDGLNVSGKVKADAKAVYKIIAQAESRAHGRKVSEIHFHEVGSMDAVADIVSVCMLMERLAPDRVIASPVCTGFGHVHSSHGIIPVPAPACAYILEDIPSYEGDIGAELCTPTGAALIKHFAGGFGRMPLLYSKKTGYGTGTKDFERCNALRAVTGESRRAAGDAFSGSLSPGEAVSEQRTGTEDASDAVSEKETAMRKPSEGALTDRVTELSLTVDDMTGEEIGFACERFFEAGALDVYTCPVYMKKNRPGCVIDILVKESQRDKMIPVIFRYTSTIGIREALCERYILKRKTEVIQTPFGPVRRKVSEGYGAVREKPEYEDLSRIAAETGLSPAEIREHLKEM